MVVKTTPVTGTGLVPEGASGLEKPIRISVTGEIEGGTTPADTDGLPAAGRTFGLGPAVVVDEDSSKDIDPDSLEAIRERMKEKIGTIEPYHLKFSPDYIGNGMGLFFSTGIGFGLMNQVAFSDLLGDHHFFLQFSLYGSLEDSDIMFSYYYLKRRLDYSFGIFQFKNYLNSRVTSVGEIFTDYRYFTERNYGVFADVSYPFSMFTRVDLDLQAFISEREFYSSQSVIGTPEEDLFLEDQASQRRLFQPTLSFVHDTAYYGYFGPVIGTRWMLSASRAVSFSSQDISRTTVLFDFRKYFPLWYRNYLAVRGVTSVSTGPDRRFYFLGGPMTLRGYDYLQFQGPRMALFNVEYRYPLVDALIFGWPGRWGLTNIGGTVFFDTGSVWGEPIFIEPLDPRIGAREINGLKFYSDFGFGFFMRFGYLVLDFQFGWPTDFNYTGRSVFHFYIGPQF
jgi:outer membrane protein assembly factor BamA